MSWLLPLIAMLVMAVALLRQIQARRKAEHELNGARRQIHSREGKIQTILNNAPIVFSAVDAKGIFHISEGKGLEKLGRKANQSVGLSIYEMHGQSPIILDAVKRALTGEQVSTSFVLKGISYDLFIGPELSPEGEVIGASMLSVDTTDRKRVEEEKAQLQIREQMAIETSKMKSLFLATMSHEIRTPIGGVIGMTSLLLDTELTAEQHEYAEAIKESSHGLLTVINDILDFSKIEAGKLDFEEIDFDLPGLVRHIVKNLSFTADLKNIDLSVDFGQDLLTWVKGDPGRLRQILNNLIGNAIKFTDHGQVSVRVLAVAGAKDRHTVRIEIQDTGIGMAKDVFEKMFTAFSQADASMSRRFGGTGLGLSIAKQLAEKMGGNVEVISEAGRGSTFSVIIPFVPGNLPIEIHASPDQTNQSAPKPGDHRILVAEDNRINQLIVVGMLDKLGIKSDVVGNGLEAIEALKKARYDLVLMDCQMPQMGGLEATECIRKGDFGLNPNVPIVALTANAMSDDRDKSMAAGMDDYLSKPIVFNEFSRVINRWIHSQHSTLKAS